MRNGLLSLLLFAIAALPASADVMNTSLSSGEAGGVHVESFHSHGRLLIDVDESVDSQLKSDAKGFELFLKGVGLADLGAPLGEEQQWAGQFRSIHDPRLGSLNFEEVGGGVKVTGTWKFPAGREALAHPEMETFDFRQNSPARYVLDFWVRSGPTLAELRAQKEREEQKSKLERADAESRLRASRRLASDQRKAELEDVTRFCREPLSDAKDIFLPFYPVHEKPDFSRWFPVTTPDNGYSYSEPKDAAKDAQYVRLALDLYRKGDSALAIRTLDFMDAETPNSDYRHEMRFLRANALIRLGLQDKAEKLLQAIVAEDRQSPVSLPAAEYLAAKQFERKQYLGAADSFLWLENHYPTHVLAWVFHLGTAESLYQLRQTERAAKEYEWIIENAQNNVDKAEGAFRQGDLYMERFQYAQGLASYSRGMTYFKDLANKFPAVFVNRAEALYGLGEYDRAREAFEAFRKDYPAHPAGWRATFRIGEIDGRKSGDEARASSRKAFYATINGYPTSPGATLARLRLLPCGDHGGFDAESMDRFFDGEAENFDGGGQVGMPKYPAFRALAHVRTLVSLGRDPEAVDLAADELKGGTSIDLEHALGSSLGAIFRHSVLALLDSGKKYEALSLYERRYQQLPRPDLSTDPDYLLTLSRTASDLGLGELAGRIDQSYQKAEAALKAPPPKGDLEADLRTSERNFSEAKSAYVVAGGAPDEKAEGKIRELLATVRPESRFSFETEVMLGLLDERKKELPSALSHAARAQILVPGGAHDFRVDAWLGSLQSRAGEPAAALETYRNVENHLALQAREQAAAKADSTAKAAAESPQDIEDETLGLPPLPDLGDVQIAESEILEKLNRWGDAAANYERAMQAGTAGDEAAYGYARALLKTGIRADRAKAYAVLADLASGKSSAQSAKAKARQPASPGGPGGMGQDDFWKKLAQEALENEKMDNDVTKEGTK